MCVECEYGKKEKNLKRRLENTRAAKVCVLQRYNLNVLFVLFCLLFKYLLPQYIVKLFDYLLIMQYFYQSLSAHSTIVSRSVSKRYFDKDLNPFRGRIDLLCDFFLITRRTQKQERIGKGVKVHANILPITVL